MHDTVPDMTFPSPSQVGSTQCKIITINDDSIFEESLIVNDTVTLSASQNRVTASGTTIVTVHDDDGTLRFPQKYTRVMHILL